MYVYNKYLDNCCYNRPYDDQSQLRIATEAQATLYVQDLISQKKLRLVSSYVLWYENGQNPFEIRKRSISEFIRKNTTEYIDIDKAEDIKCKADEIMKTGVKTKDAYHVACAIYANCDYFLTTDVTLLRYTTDEIQIVDLINFIIQ